jgi:hypothetical protein
MFGVRFVQNGQIQRQLPARRAASSVLPRKRSHEKSEENDYASNDIGTNEVPYRGWDSRLAEPSSWPSLERPLGPLFTLTAP